MNEKKIKGSSEGELKEVLNFISPNATVNGKYLMYRERPLVREGNVIVYGNRDDEYILVLTIFTTKKYNGSEVPAKVLVQIQKNDNSLGTTDTIVKQDMKDGLSEAFDLGIVWLERLLGDA